jgi:carbamoyltransferase
VVTAAPKGAGPLRVLGISAFYHDSAAALVCDGAIVAAAQEERFTRIKHDASFPARAVQFCRHQGGIALRDVDLVVFYDKPYRTFSRIIATYLQHAPRGIGTFREAMKQWLGGKLQQKRNLRRALRQVDAGYDAPIAFAEHHQSHGASAYYPSPFESAAVLTMDGVGEWATTSIGRGRGREFSILEEQHFPHSLGLFYSAFTDYLGFKVNSGEYKVMGLAPYGVPKYVRQIKDNLIALNEDGSFALNLRFFDFCTGWRMTNEGFAALFGQPRRRAESELTPFHMDLAASLQAVLEDAVCGLARRAVACTGESNLCLAGGVALNCVANARVLREKVAQRLWIQPAGGDAGGSIGAAFSGYHQLLGGYRPKPAGDAMQGAYLGPAFSDDQALSQLGELGAVGETVSWEETVKRTAQRLSEGAAVGWVQGRMEFGPRALGSRSILADPRRLDAQRNLNLKVKFRESFRPFAPIVLLEDAAKWFDIDVESPYMLLVAPVVAERRREMTEEEQALFGIQKLNVCRSEIPAVTHVDYSARLQTVSDDTNPRLTRLLREFKSLTGCPVLVNTSFNVRGEPIVCTPADAYKCFMHAGLDLLVVGQSLFEKDRQPERSQLGPATRLNLD